MLHIAFVGLLCLVSVLLGSIFEAKYQWLAFGKQEAWRLWAQAEARLQALEQAAAAKEAALVADGAKLLSDSKL